MIPIIDLSVVIAAGWLLVRHIGNLGHMTRKTSWRAYAQVLSAAGSAAAVLLSYAQWLAPNPEYVSFLNVGNSTAILVVTMVANSIMDPRRRTRLDTMRRDNVCVVNRPRGGRVA